MSYSLIFEIEMMRVVGFECQFLIRSIHFNFKN